MQRHTRPQVRRPSSQAINPPVRRPNRKRKNVKRIVLRGVLLIGLVALAVFLLTNHRFIIRSERITGNQTVPRAEIEALAPIPAHKNVFLYVAEHHKQIAARLETGEPAILQAHVRPGWPNVMAVRIVERKGYVQLRENHGALYLVDRQGVPFRVLEARAPDLVAVVVPNGSVDPVLGKPLPTTSDTPLGAAFEALDVIHSTGAFAPGQIRDVRVDQNLDLCLNTDSDLLIKLGQPNDLPRKLSSASAILADDNQQASAALYVDVTEPDHPAFMPRPSTAGSPIGSPGTAD